MSNSEENNHLKLPNNQEEATVGEDEQQCEQYQSQLVLAQKATNFKVQIRKQRNEKILKEKRFKFNASDINNQANPKIRQNGPNAQAEKTVQIQQAKNAYISETQQLHKELLQTLKVNYCQEINLASFSNFNSSNMDPYHQAQAASNTLMYNQNEQNSTMTINAENIEGVLILAEKMKRMFGDHDRVVYFEEDTFYDLVFNTGIFHTFYNMLCCLIKQLVGNNNNTNNNTNLNNYCTLLLSTVLDCLGNMSATYSPHHIQFMLQKSHLTTNCLFLLKATSTGVVSASFQILGNLLSESEELRRSILKEGTQFFMQLFQMWKLHQQSEQILADTLFFAAEMLLNNVTDQVISYCDIQNHTSFFITLLAFKHNAKIANYALNCITGIISTVYVGTSSNYKNMLKDDFFQHSLISKLAVFAQDNVMSKFQNATNLNIQNQNQNINNINDPDDFLLHNIRNILILIEFILPDPDDQQDKEEQEKFNFVNQLLIDKYHCMLDVFFGKINLKDIRFKTASVLKKFIPNCNENQLSTLLTDGTQILTQYQIYLSEASPNANEQDVALQLIMLDSLQAIFQTRLDQDSIMMKVITNRFIDVLVQLLDTKYNEDIILKALTLLAQVFQFQCNLYEQGDSNSGQMQLKQNSTQCAFSQFEQCNGNQMLEQLCVHQNENIFKIATCIIDTYFDCTVTDSSQ